ncbi:MAG TPA: hypothetical protein VGH74_05930 [Planctomycetaceae bacterium]|jgi:hypothetical protein
MRRRGGAPPISLFSFQDIITSVTGIMILVTLMLAIEMVNQTESAPPQKTGQISALLENSVADTTAQIEEAKRELEQRQQAVADVAGLDAGRVNSEYQNLTELERRLKREVDDSQRDFEAAKKRRTQAHDEQERRKADLPTLAQVREEQRQVDEELQKLKKSKRIVFNPAEGAEKRAWLLEVSGERILKAEVGKLDPPQEFLDSSAFKKWASGRIPADEYFVLLVKPSGIEMSRALQSIIAELGFELGVDLLAEDQTAIDRPSGAAPP